MLLSFLSSLWHSGSSDLLVVGAWCTEVRNILCRKEQYPLLWGYQMSR